VLGQKCAQRSLPVVAIISFHVLDPQADDSLPPMFSYAFKRISASAPATILVSTPNSATFLSHQLTVAVISLSLEDSRGNSMNSLSVAVHEWSILSGRVLRTKLRLCSLFIVGATHVQLGCKWCTFSFSVRQVEVEMASSNVILRSIFAGNNCYMYQTHRCPQCSPATSRIQLP